MTNNNFLQKAKSFGTLVKKGSQILFANDSKESLQYLFDAQKFIDQKINETCLNIYNNKHPKHHMWPIHYQFILDNVDSGSKVLDVGTGASSSYTQELASRCKQLDCCDYKEELVERSRRENKFSNVDFIVMDITKDLPDVYYDVVIMSHILEHIHDPKAVLERMAGITDKIIIRLPRYDDHWMYLVKKDLGMFYFKDHDHKDEYTLKKAVELVESAGWKIQTALNDVDVKIVAVKK